MATIAGMVAFRGAPVPFGTARELEQSTARFGTASHHECPVVSSVQCVARKLSERELKECELVKFDRIACSWNGRIDNRTDLDARLGTRGSTHTDAALVAALYEQWGVAGLRHIVGDWSVAIVDMRTREVTLARDYYGARPLFYSMDHDGLRWSGSLGELVVRSEAFHNLDDEYVAANLMALTLPNRTPYRGVTSVPPGTAITWNTEGRSRSTELWDPSRVPHVSGADYQEGLRHYFEEGVKVRLSYSGAVWAELSGGLDSSAVVCMAHRLIRSGTVRASELHTISFYAEGSRASDERPYIQTVEEHVGRRGIHVSFHEHAHEVNSEWGWVTPDQRHGITLAICHRARDNGAAMLLTGDAGDQVFGNMASDAYDVAADLRQWELRSAVRGAADQARRRKGIIYTHLADAAGILLKVPYGRRRLMQQRLALFGGDSGSLKERVCQSYLVTERYGPLWLNRVDSELQQLANAADLSKAALLFALRSDETTRSAYECEGIATTHPIAHRPLVEYVLGVPCKEWRRPDSPRALMRAAFSSFMPPRIIQRTSKGDPSPAIMRDAGAVAAQWSSGLGDLEVVRRGYIDPDRLRTKLEAVKDSGCVQLMPLPMLMRVERWLQAREHAVRLGTPTLRRKEVTPRDLQDTTAYVCGTDRYARSR